MVFYDRGLREPLTIGVVLEDPSIRTLRGEVFERSGFEHEL